MFFVPFYGKIFTETKSIRLLAGVSIANAISKRYFKVKFMKQQVRDQSDCNFSSWQYVSERRVLKIFYIFLCLYCRGGRSAIICRLFPCNYKHDPYSMLKGMERNSIRKCLLIMLD